MKYVKTYLPTLKTHVVNLKHDAKDLSRDLQRLEVRGKLESKNSLMPFDLLSLEPKFSSVVSTAVPVSGLVPVLQRSVGSSPRLSLVSPVLSTVKHRLPVEPKIRFRVERPSVTFK